MVVRDHSTVDTVDLALPYQRCAYPSDTYGVPSEVDYFVDWQGGSPNGFVYEPGSGPNHPNQADMCIFHIGGPWWAVMSGANESDSRACPNSFSFEGAPYRRVVGVIPRCRRSFRRPVDGASQADRAIPGIKYQDVIGAATMQTTPRTSSVPAPGVLFPQ